ncbi:hypothetical protein BJX63DRAFT_205 [Aspergillus granulosus]|uniref:Uncharacterized protein n=1 Tax=Aspergillus granulosus TaxID=176169 RepID=A0ABR4I518_9EURO
MARLIIMISHSALTSPANPGGTASLFPWMAQNVLGYDERGPPPQRNPHQIVCPTGVQRKHGEVKGKGWVGMTSTGAGIAWPRLTRHRPPKYGGHRAPLPIAKFSLAASMCMWSGWANQITLRASSSRPWVFIVFLDLIFQTMHEAENRSLATLTRIANSLFPSVTPMGSPRSATALGQGGKSWSE